jgi:hypothetical protein
MCLLRKAACSEQMQSKRYAKWGMASEVLGPGLLQTSEAHIFPHLPDTGYATTGFNVCLVGFWSNKDLI